MDVCSFSRWRPHTRLCFLVMGTKRYSPAVVSSLLLIGFWKKGIKTSLCLSQPGERSNLDLTPSSQVLKVCLWGCWPFITPKMSYWSSLNKKLKLPCVCFWQDLIKGWIVFSFRSGNIAQTRETEDPGFHPVSKSSGQKSGVLWWSLHSEAGFWFWWNYRVEWQLQGLAKREARVEEVYRRAPPDVFIC